MKLLKFSLKDRIILKIPIIKQESSSLMEAIQLLGKKLDRIVAIATRVQLASMSILACIILTRELGKDYLPNYNYKVIAQGFSAFMILCCITLNRTYSYYLKKHQDTNLISSNEQTFIRHEHLGRFLWPLILWIISFVIFRWL